jgi:signal transduction histidine kinase
MNERAARADAVVQTTLARGAWFGERAISVARLGLVAFVLARHLFIGGAASALAGHADALIGIGTLGVGVVASALVLRGLGKTPRAVPRRLLFASVTLDAALCHLALLPNALWPEAGYEGLLRMPDTAAILIVLATAGVRLDAGVAAAATALHAVGTATLLAVDHVVGRPQLTYGGKEVAIFSIYFVVVGVFALGSARGMRVLATESARAALAARRARLGLRELLQDHHDVRSALSSAMMRADRLAPQLGGDADASTAAAGLRADLDEVARLVGATRDRAYKELAELDAPQPADVAKVARSVVDVLTRRFPDVTFALDCAAERLDASVVGGPQGLSRVLLNLLVNAREGDGTRGATHVALSVGRRDGAVHVIVTDDGPGFPAAVLGARPGAFVSTKEEGSGIGMFLVASVVDASGGSVERANRDAGGAEVRVSLPVP